MTGSAPHPSQQCAHPWNFIRMSLLHRTRPHRHRFHFTKNTLRACAVQQCASSLHFSFFVSNFRLQTLHFDGNQKMHFDCSNGCIGGSNSYSKSFALTWKIPRPTLSDFSKTNHFFSSAAKWGIYFGSELLSLAVRANVQHAQKVHSYGLFPKQLASRQQFGPVQKPGNFKIL